MNKPSRLSCRSHAYPDPKTHPPPYRWNQIHPCLSLWNPSFSRYGTATCICVLFERMPLLISMANGRWSWKRSTTLGDLAQRENIIGTHVTIWDYTGYFLFSQWETVISSSTLDEHHGTENENCILTNDVKNLKQHSYILISIETYSSTSIHQHIRQSLKSIYQGILCAFTAHTSNHCPNVNE